MVDQNTAEAESIAEMRIKQLLHVYWDIHQQPERWKTLWTEVKQQATTGVLSSDEGVTTPAPIVTQQFDKSHAELVAELLSLVKLRKQVILTGAPGTGKTYLAKEMAAAMIGVPVEVLQGNATLPEQYEFRQFHSGYDYSDFVEGLKPKVTKDGEPYFERADGVFMAFCKKAYNAIKEDLELAETESDEAEARAYIEDACIQKPFVMVIDEINRADLSRVFGELFYGLEKDYRGEKIPTQYDYLSGESFSIPPNVYIIGTMNDIDRSVESMDFALRRRFAWQEITIEDSHCILDSMSDTSLRLRAIGVMTKVNDEIIAGLLGLEPAYFLGGAYYRDLEDYADDTTDVSEWEMLWKHNLSVILTEYLRASRRNVDIESLHQKYTDICNEAERLELSSDTQSLDGFAWIISPGEDASKWQLFQNENIIALSFEQGIGDLNQFANLDELKAKMKEVAPEHYTKQGALRINAFMLWHFAHSLKPGTVIFARKGIKPGIATILGRGEITGHYTYNASRPDYNHELGVRWTWRGNASYAGTLLSGKLFTQKTPRIAPIVVFCSNRVAL